MWLNINPIKHVLKCCCAQTSFKTSFNTYMINSIMWLNINHIKHVLKCCCAQKVVFWITVTSPHASRCWLAESREWRYIWYDVLILNSSEWIRLFPIILGQTYLWVRCIFIFGKYTSYHLCDETNTGFVNWLIWLYGSYMNSLQNESHYVCKIVHSGKYIGALMLCHWCFIALSLSYMPKSTK